MSPEPVKKPFYVIWLTVQDDNTFKPVLDEGKWKTEEEARTYAQGLRLIFTYTPQFIIFGDINVLAPPS